MKYIVIILFCFFTTISLHAQKNLEGKILDTETGLPLPGANIFWAGTTRGTSSNAAGYFVLKRERSIDLLVISFVGYGADTIKVEKGTEYYEHSINPVNSIDEVIVFGREEGTFIDRQNPLLTYKITGAELARAACCNLSESFTTNASVDISFSDAATGAKQIQLLGLAGSYVQIMTENFPSLYGLGSSYGLNYIPGSWMESIQVSKGTASVRNGHEAITGQINVEFKKPADSEKLFLNFYGNSAGKTEGNLNTSLKLSERLTTALLAHVENDYIIDDRNKDGFRDDPDVKQYHLFNRWDYLTETFTFRAGVRLMEEERVGGQVSFLPSEVDNPGGSYGIMIKTTRAEAFTKTGILFPADRSMSLGWINSFTLHDQESIFGTTSYNGSQRSYYTNLLYQWKPLLNEHTIDAGVSFRYDDYSEALNNTILSRTERSPGVFVQYSYVDTSKVSIVAGLRADFNNLYGTFITPRIHFMVNLGEKSSLRATVGKGFRTTNVLAENQYLLASSRVLDIQDNLLHEEAWNAGVNITSYYNVAGNDLRLSADYYHTRFINQIVADLDSDVNTVMFYNLDGQSFSNVFQVEAGLEPISRLDLLLAIRLNDVRMTTAGKLQRRALSSRYKGMFTASYLTYLRKWQYDLTFQFNGPGRVPSTADNPAQYQRADSFDPYMLINGQINRKFKLWELYLGVENLTNFKQENPVISADNPFSDYFDTSLVWGPTMGRMIYGGIRITIN
jgi:outer membrane receptor for ferrienterochelin and colicins